RRAGNYSSETGPQAVKDWLTRSALKGKGLDVSPGYPNGLRRRKVANRAFLPSEEGDHPAMHSVVELNTDILAFNAHTLHGEAGGDHQREQHDRWPGGCTHRLSFSSSGFGEVQPIQRAEQCQLRFLANFLSTFGSTANHPLKSNIDPYIYYVSYSARKNKHPQF